MNLRQDAFVFSIESAKRDQRLPEIRGNISRISHFLILASHGIGSVSMNWLDVNRVPD